MKKDLITITVIMAFVLLILNIFFWGCCLLPAAIAFKTVSIQAGILPFCIGSIIACALTAMSVFGLLYFWYSRSLMIEIDEDEEKRRKEERA